MHLLRQCVTFGALLSASWLCVSTATAQSPITHPDTARVERSSDLLLWDYTNRISDTDSTVFGPDASPIFFAERDSVTLIFGEHTSAIAYRAASIQALAGGGAYRVLSAGSGARYYSGSDHPDPSTYDHKMWPGITGNAFTGTDGHLYRIAYQEFQAWTVKNAQGEMVYDCPDPTTTTLEAGLERCWYNAFVLTRSTDGGATWSLAGATPADYLVASSPYRFQEQQNRTRHGAFPGATGLFKVDGYYYFPVTLWGEGFQIATLMRSDDISDASSWRYWDGEAFSMPNTDAYTRGSADPESLLPAPFDDTEGNGLNPTGSPVEGLARSAYYDAYIRTVVRAYNAFPEVKPGVYYQLSKDGFQWSGPILLYSLSYASRLPSGIKVGGRSENFAYPVLVSEQLPSTSDIGETAWLAYVTFNPSNPGSPDRDIRMVRVRFANRDVNGFIVTHTNLKFPEDANPGDGYCDNGYGRCSLLTALDESNHRLPWLPDTLKYHILVSGSLSGTLSEPYLPMVRRPVHADFSSADVRIPTMLAFGVGSEGSEVDGMSIGSMVVGEYGLETSIRISGSRIDSLAIYGNGTLIRNNDIGMLVVDGMENRVDSNQIGDLGRDGIRTDRSTAPVTILSSGNELIGNTIGGTDYRAVNLTGEEASDNLLQGNTIGGAASSGGASIAIVNGVRNRIEANTIAFGGTEGGVFLLDAGDNVIVDNDIRDHLGSGVTMSGSSTGNRIGLEGLGNRIHANGGFGIDRFALQTEGNPLIGNAVYENSAGAISLPGFDPTPAPQLLSAYRGTNDSVLVRYRDVRGLDPGPVVVELFGNSSSDNIQARVAISGSRHTWNGETVSEHRIVVADTLQGLVMTSTDPRDETSVLSAPVAILQSGQGPIAAPDSTQIRRTHSQALRVETVTMRVRNTGANALRFTAQAGSSWIGIEGSQPFEIAAGSHLDLGITLDSREASGVLQDTLILTTNEESRYRLAIPVAVSIQTQSATLRVLPDTLRVEVPRPAVETTIQRFLKVTAQSGTPIPWNITKNQPWITSLTPVSGTLNPGDTVSVAVNIRVRPTDALGTRTAILVVFANIGGNNVPHEVPVSLTLTNATDVEDDVERPVAVRLHPATPNPFNPSTVIRYELPEAMPVRMELYSVTGVRIRVLVDGTQTAGTHLLRVDGNGLASGVYLYRLTAGDRTLTGRMTLLK